MADWRAAFDEIASEVGGQGARLPASLSADLGAKASEYKADIASRLTAVGDKFSRSNYGSFADTIRRSGPAAEAPPSEQRVSARISPWLLGLGVLFVIWGVTRRG